MTELEMVENAKEGERIVFPETSRLEYVHFDLRDYGDGPEYSWTAKQKDSWHCIMPYGSAINTIATFKTLKGAKQRFVKQCGWMFQKQEQA